MEKKCIVENKYVTPFSNPVILKRGDIVALHKKDTEWEGWKWCSTKDENFGWVPENCLEIEDDRAVVNSNYDATELNVEIGEVITALKGESGWYWCKKEDGSEGWVPADHLVLIE